MNSVPKLFSCSYADCWTEKHFSTEFGVLTPNHTHSHTLFWECVSRWFGRALAWHARGQRFDPAILHQKSTVFRRKYGAFLFCSGKKIRGCTARHTGGPVTPPISNETVIWFNACSVFRAAPTAPCQEPPAYFYADGFFMGAGGLRKPRC